MISLCFGLSGVESEAQRLPEVANCWAWCELHKLTAGRFKIRTRVQILPAQWCTLRQASSPSWALICFPLGGSCCRENWGLLVFSLDNLLISASRKSVSTSENRCSLLFCALWRFLIKKNHCKVEIRLLPEQKSGMLTASVTKIKLST